MAKIVDTGGTFSHLSLRIPITIIDVRQAFGRTDYLVKPVGGSGETWVDSRSVYLNNMAQ